MSIEVADRTPAPEPLAAAPPRRHRGMFIGLLGAVFLSGGVVGGGVGMLVTQQKFSDCLRHPERMPEKMITKFRADLGLTDEQTAKIGEIVRRHHENFESIRAEVRPRFAAEFTSMGDEINLVLTESQQVMWKDMREKFRKDFPRGKRERKNRDEVKK